MYRTEVTQSKSEMTMTSMITKRKIIELHVQTNSISIQHGPTSHLKSESGHVANPAAGSGLAALAETLGAAAAASSTHTQPGESLVTS